MNRWNRFDWLLASFFAILVILFYWRILTPDLADRQSFPPGDFHAQFWAFATHEVRELSAGRLPLWNPYTFAGTPFWADVQAAVFYPPSLLTLLLSAPWGFSLFALELEAIAHFWLAAIFMYLFCRALTGSRAAALVATLTFTFSGYLTGYPSQQLAVLEADVWLPLILFCLYRASEAASSPSFTLRFSWFTGKAATWLLLAGVAWGMALLAGHPQSAFIIACVSTGYLVFVLRSQEIEDRKRREVNTHHAPHTTYYALRPTPYVLPILFFLLTGLALAAIQFIPAVEYTLLSVRAEGTYDRMSGGFPLTDIIQMLLPGQVSFYSPLYVGVIGLILALTAIFTIPNRQTLFWGVVAGLGLLISFGGNTFFYSPLYLFAPGFSIFRGQERWVFPVVFSLSILAGYGFRQILTEISPPSSHLPAPTSHVSRFTFHASRFTFHVSRFTLHVSHFTRFLLLFALLLLFLFFYGLNDTGWSPESPFYGLLGAASLLTLLLLLAWLLWKFSARLHPGLLTTLTVLLICLDLFSVNWQTNLYPQLPEWHTQMPALVRAIKEDAAASPGQPYRVYNEFRLYDNYGVPYQLEDLWGASPLRPARYDEFLAPPMPIERSWELFNVKYVITWRQELFVPSTIIYQEPAADGTTYVHRLAQVGPRAWLANQVEVAGAATLLQKIADPAFDRWQIALLEPDEAAEAGLTESLSSSHISSSAAQVSPLTFHSPQSLSVQVETATPALLIFSEPYYPGWQATLDGRPVPLLRAHYILRAVAVPEGEHRVTLEFRPRSFVIGAVISGLALIVMSTILFLAFRGRNRQ